MPEIDYAYSLLKDRRRTYYIEQIQEYDSSYNPGPYDDVELEYFTRVNAGTIPELANEGSTAVYVREYGAIGDASDEYTKLNNAFTAGAGKVVVLEKDKTYGLGSHLSIPAGTTIISNGAKFRKLTASATQAITVNANCTIDSLVIDSVGSSSVADFALYINGDNITINRVVVNSLTADCVTGGSMAVTIGNASGFRAASMRTNNRIGHLTITNYRTGLRIWNLQKSFIDDINITNFLNAVYIFRAQHCTFRKANISGTSPSSTGGNGQNGLLIGLEQASGWQDEDINGLNFYDWVVNGAPEHSYRLGGDTVIANVSFTNCQSINPGNAPGNVATGGGAWKALGVSGRRHRNLSFINCVAEDANTDASGIANHSQFSLSHVECVRLVNPVVKKLVKTYSAQIALYLNSVLDVQVVNPDFRDTKTYALFIGKDGSDASLFGVSQVKISGGFVHSAVTHAIYLDTQTTTTADVYLDRVTIVGNATVPRALRQEAIGSGGAYNNVHLDISYRNIATIGAEPALVTTNDVYIYYRGPVYGYTISAANGSNMVNTTAGSTMIRKAGAWTTL